MRQVGQRAFASFVFVEHEGNDGTVIQQPAPEIAVLEIIGRDSLQVCTRLTGCLPAWLISATSRIGLRSSYPLPPAPRNRALTTSVLAFIMRSFRVIDGCRPMPTPDRRYPD